MTIIESIFLKKLLRNKIKFVQNDTKINKIFIVFKNFLLVCLNSLLKSDRTGPTIQKDYN
ncbi:hypothetical protein BpHYR1_052856 [Brachionus plicatilis]|uniref:Uncharacterized protein n=1 Tax=Brachionus plicatilis TaxID=10195 RepID=A0A3M7RJD6_BRAPC|nr:hypothetical protein BpHYR1_052856 [Brachionus plicatilis]